MFFAFLRLLAAMAFAFPQLTVLDDISDLHLSDSARPLAEK
jgi:hypothetical protein